MKRWLLLMTKENLAKCEDGRKTQTRRTNPRLAGIRAGDELFFRSDYKTTYRTASGPYIATENARWGNVRDICANDCIAEGIEDPKIGTCEGLSSSRWIEKIFADFKALWDSINTKPPKRWKDNPRVLRIAYQKETHEKAQKR